MPQSATTTAYYNSSRSPSPTYIDYSPTTNSGLSSLLSCPDGAPTVLDCQYSADVVVFYFLPTTINVTAATVYNNASPPYTVTNNLSSYYSSIAYALVPAPQTSGEGTGTAQTTVGLAFNTPEVQYQEVFSASADLSYSTPVTLVPPTAYMEATIDGVDITYYCHGTQSGSTFSSTFETEVAPTVYFMFASLPSSNSLWGNQSAMANLPEAILTTVPSFDAVFHSENPDLPLCTGNLNGYPSPMVVVNQLTATVGAAAQQGAISSAGLPANTGLSGSLGSSDSSTISDSPDWAGSSGPSRSPGSWDSADPNPTAANGQPISVSNGNIVVSPVSTSTGVGVYIVSGLGDPPSGNTATTYTSFGSIATRTANGTATGYSGPLWTGGANGGISDMVVITSWLCGLAIGIIVVM